MFPSGVKRFTVSFVLACLVSVPFIGVLPGCNRTPPPPPPLTEDLKAKIQEEDKAVEEAERAQSQSARP